eukprot:1331743-Pleurochrysis_carterae.AAC.7
MMFCFYGLAKVVVVMFGDSACTVRPALKPHTCLAFYSLLRAPRTDADKLLCCRDAVQAHAAVRRARARRLRSNSCVSRDLAGGLAHVAPCMQLHIRTYIMLLISTCATQV